jgi:hypothetical protein
MSDYAALLPPHPAFGHLLPQGEGKMLHQGFGGLTEHVRKIPIIL